MTILHDYIYYIYVQIIYKYVHKVYINLQSVLLFHNLSIFAISEKGYEKAVQIENLYKLCVHTVRTYSVDFRQEKFNEKYMYLIKIYIKTSNISIHVIFPHCKKIVNWFDQKWFKNIDFLIILSVWVSLLESIEENALYTFKCNNHKKQLTLWYVNDNLLNMTIQDGDIFSNVNL